MGLGNATGRDADPYNKEHSKTMKVNSMIPINELLIKSKKNGSHENSIMDKSYMTK